LDDVSKALAGNYHNIFKSLYMSCIFLWSRTVY
jgi:hypothetical protein